MKKNILVIVLASIFMMVPRANCQDKEIKNYRGVVTFQLIPAKILKINQIIENPKPGTSYIGDRGILVEVSDNPNIIANWTVVDVQYYLYAEPKTINYEILSEQKQLNVNYHAVKVTIDGDLSQYIKE